MKNYLVIAILMASISQWLPAQMCQGTFSVGPILDLASVREELDGFTGSVTSSSTLLGLNAAYFVADNLSISLDLVRRSSAVEDEVSEEKQSGFYAGPRLTYMVGLGNQWYLPVFAGSGYNRQAYEVPGSDIVFGGWSYGLGAGVEYVVASKVGARWALSLETGSISHDDSGLELDIVQASSRVGVIIYIQ